MTTLLNAIPKQLPSSQETWGHDKLDLAHELTDKFQPVIAENDRRTKEDKVTL